MTSLESLPLKLRLMVMKYLDDPCDIASLRRISRKTDIPIEYCFDGMIPTAANIGYSRTYIQNYYVINTMIVDN